MKVFFFLLSLLLRSSLNTIDLLNKSVFQFNEKKITTNVQLIKLSFIVGYIIELKWIIFNVLTTKNQTKYRNSNQLQREKKKDIHRLSPKRKTFKAFIRFGVLSVLFFYILVRIGLKAAHANFLSTHLSEHGVHAFKMS